MPEPGRPVAMSWARDLLSKPIKTGFLHFSPAHHHQNFNKISVLSIFYANFALIVHIFHSTHIFVLFFPIH